MGGYRTIRSNRPGSSSDPVLNQVQIDQNILETRSTREPVGITDTQVGKISYNGIISYWNLISMVPVTSITGLEISVTG